MYEVYDDLGVYFRRCKNTHIGQNPENLSHTEEIAFLNLVWEQYAPSLGDVRSENPVVRKALAANTRPGGGTGLQCGGFETWSGCPAPAAVGRSRRVSFHRMEERTLECDISRGWGTQGGRAKQVSVRVQGQQQ